MRFSNRQVHALFKSPPTPATRFAEAWKVARIVRDLGEAAPKRAAPTT